MALLRKQKKSSTAVEQEPLVLTVIKESGVKDVTPPCASAPRGSSFKPAAPIFSPDVLVISNGTADNSIIGDVANPVDVSDKDRAERAFEEYYKLPSPRTAWIAHLANSLGIPTQWIKDWAVQYNWAAKARSRQNEERRDRLSNALYSTINNLVVENPETGDVTMTIPISDMQDLERATKVWDKLTGGADDNKGGNGATAVTVIIKND